MDSSSGNRQPTIVASWLFQASGGFPAFEVDVTSDDIADMDRGGLIGNDRRFHIWMKWIREHPLTAAQEAAIDEEWDHGWAHIWNMDCPCDDICDAPDMGIRKPDAYFAGAVRLAARQVQRAPIGDRNNTLFKAAASLFELPARMGMSGSRLASASQDIHEALADAAMAAGLRKDEVEATLRSARATADMEEEAPTRKPEMFW